jgi:hypothetical protein
VLRLLFGLSQFVRNFNLTRKLISSDCFCCIFVQLKIMKVSNNNFHNVVKSIYDLPLEDKLELKQILEHNIVEQKRAQILKNFKEAKSDEADQKLVFSDSIVKLKKLL